jgi:hypothetical protein
MIDKQLRTTPVIHDQRHVLQVKPLQKLRDQQGNAVNAQVGPEAHRFAVGA